jgi:hypothetical protein
MHLLAPGRQSVPLVEARPRFLEKHAFRLHESAIGILRERHFHRLGPTGVKLYFPKPPHVPSRARPFSGSLPSL